MPAETHRSRRVSSARRRSSRAPRRRAAGLTLVELLVAACVAGTALGAAWPWVWNAGRSARAEVARAQAGTSVSYALRVLREDLAQATAVLAPADGRPASTTLYLRHDHPGEPFETVAVVWDASRKVLWRKAPGTYLADHVDGFSVCYFRADGTQLLGGDFAASGWVSSVARVRVTISTRDAEGAAAGVLDAVPGPA